MLEGMKKVIILQQISFNSNCNPHICIPQAFGELQAKMIDTQQKVKLADLQIEQLSRMKKHANLTHAEITSLPDTTRMFEGAGRMYVHFCWCKIWAWMRPFFYCDHYVDLILNFPGSFYSQKMRSPISFWISRRPQMRRLRSLR